MTKGRNIGVLRAIRIRIWGTNSGGSVTRQEITIQTPPQISTNVTLVLRLTGVVQCLLVTRISSLDRARPCVFAILLKLLHHLQTQRGKSAENLCRIDLTDLTKKLSRPSRGQYHNDDEIRHIFLPIIQLRNENWAGVAKAFDSDCSQGQRCSYTNLSCQSIQQETVHRKQSTRDPTDDAYQT